MKIGRLEIRWLKNSLPYVVSVGEVDLSAHLVVPETDNLWRAVHQVINEIERETIETARRHTANPNLCIADIGAGEGCALVRLRLIERRENAIAEAKKIRREAG